MIARIYFSEELYVNKPESIGFKQKKIISPKNK